MISPTPLRVLLLPAARTDHWMVRIGECLPTEITGCDDAASCADALARTTVDLVLVDLDAHISDDSEETDRAVNAAVDVACSIGTVPVVAVADTADGRRTRLLEAGVSVLVDPDIPGEELAAQLASMHRLVNDSPSSILVFHDRTMEVEHDGRRVAVTDTEWKLLSVLHAQPDRFFSPAELMERVWGHTTGPTSTVSVHLHRIRHKLETDPEEPTLLVTRRGHGYALVSAGFLEMQSNRKAPRRLESPADEQRPTI